MNNNLNLSPEQIASLTRLAGQRMGADPEKLRVQMESGQMDGILSGLNPGQREQIQNLMNNPAAIEQLMNSPKVQLLLRGLMGR